MCSFQIQATIKYSPNPEYLVATAEQTLTHSHSGYINGSSGISLAALHSSQLSPSPCQMTPALPFLPAPHLQRLPSPLFSTILQQRISIAHSIICTVRLFRAKMHCDWFNGIELLQGRWQHGEKVGYCYPSGLVKTLCKWDICDVLLVSGTYVMSCWSRKG